MTTQQKACSPAVNETDSDTEIVVAQHQENKSRNLNINVEMNTQKENQSPTPINETDSDTEIMADQHEENKSEIRNINIDLHDPHDYVEKLIKNQDVKAVQDYADEACIDIRDQGELMLLRHNLQTLKQYGKDPLIYKKYVKYLSFTETRIVYDSDEDQHKKEFNKVALALLNHKKRLCAAPYNTFRQEKMQEIDMDKGLVSISLHPGEVCCKMSHKTKSIIFLRYKKLIYLVISDINKNKVNLIRITGEYAYHAQDELEYSSDENSNETDNNKKYKPPLQFATRGRFNKRTSRRALHTKISY